MADLCGVRVLLLWAGIIGSANCPQAPPPPQCSYTVTPVKFGFDDFLNASEIRQIPPKGIPAKINATFPRNCNNLTADYTCQEKGTINDTKLESELEPFTEYSCTGQIKNNNVSINKNTKDIQFTIDCDITINRIKQHATSNSINLSWTTTSRKCPDLPSHPKLSYDCSCVPTSKSKPITYNTPSGGTCDVTGLEPFKDHTCKVQPKYNVRIVSEPKEVKQKTDIGVPDDIPSVSVMIPEHNVVKVTCTYPKRFNGPEKSYVAKLFYGSVLQKTLKNSKCEFEFKDLSYSTEYVVEVTAYNGHHFSKNPKKETTSTSYNSFIIRLVIFLVFTIITCVAVGVAVYKIFIWRRRESRNGGNEDIMLETTAIYANIPGPERQH
ncbi:receptor-type tyrosine-protein phosphatase C-like [Centropristis striata]|uniref:receptor-type tyrosine-protein phosphatase C-like n=1 Tax=Centropristis striata TaxID=184440 RepID=UPI0027DFA9C9|nr:receptor-type tyrosine-protein phosphatase C-like [Centropristis striata]